MIDRTVAIVDYGAGNLFSIGRALETCGGIPLISDEPDDIRRAGRVILPGVGAFGDGMARLAETGMAEAICEAVRTGSQLLGVCLGMQMLFESSEEFGAHEGLGLISGKVRSLPRVGVDGVPHKIPNIGWRALREAVSGRWKDTVFGEMKSDAEMYFVHSFAADPADPADLMATYDLGGHPICAAVQRDNIAGCQFHPERSGRAGLLLIERFLNQ